MHKNVVQLKSMQYLIMRKIKSLSEVERIANNLSNFIYIAENKCVIVFTISTSFTLIFTLLVTYCENTKTKTDVQLNSVKFLASLILVTLTLVHISVRIPI